MGIKFNCPNGHKLHVKSFLAGKKGVCPKCGVRIVIPRENDESAGSRAKVGKTSAKVFDATTAKFPFDSQAQPRGGPIGRPTPIDEPDELVLFDAPADEVQFEVADIVSRPAVVGAASADPNPDAVWYVHLPNGQRLGPARRESMTQWVNAGQVPPTALVWREGWAEWKSAAAVFNRQKVQVSGPLESPQAAKATARIAGPLADILPGPISPAVVHHRGRRHLSATVTFVLLALIIVLFALMLYVFFLRNPEPKQATLRQTSCANALLALAANSGPSQSASAS